MTEPTQVRIGDVVVLTEAAERRLEQNHSMWNDDLRPCSLAEHSWPGTKFAALWVGMCLCIPTYALAGGMIASGMSWWEAVLTILVGSIVVMGAILLVSHAGTKFGIPYPVFARLWFGTSGAHVPALARAVIAAGWFGINSWFGGQALDAILTRVLPFWSALAVTFPLPAPQPFPAPLHLAFSFLIFWAINVAIAMRGPQAIGRLAQIAAPLLGHFGDRFAAVGARERARIRTDPRAAGDLARTRVLERVLPVGHRRDRVLGDARAQHPRLHALREVAARPDARPDHVDAADDGAVLVHRDRGDVGDRPALREGALEPGRVDREVSDAGRPHWRESS